MNCSMGIIKYLKSGFGLADYQFHEPKLLKDGSLSPIQYIPFLDRKIDLESICMISNAELTYGNDCGRKYSWGITNQPDDIITHSILVSFSISFKSEYSNQKEGFCSYFTWSDSLCCKEKEYEKRTDFEKESIKIVQDKIDVLADWWEKVKIQNRKEQ